MALHLTVDYVCPLSPKAQDVVESGSWEACLQEPCVAQGLFHASRLGNRALMNLFIERGACCWSDAFCGALIGGQLDIAKELVTNQPCRWPPRSFLACAFASGKKDVVDFVRSCHFGERGQAFFEAYCGWTSLEVTKRTDFSDIVCGALQGGHLHIAKFFEARAGPQDLSYQDLVSSAFQGGHPSCVEWVQKEFGWVDGFWLEAFSGACEGGNVTLARLASSHLAKPLSRPFAFRLLRELAKSSGHGISLVRDLFLEHANEMQSVMHNSCSLTLQTRYSYCSEILDQVCKTGKLDWLEFFHDTIPIHKDWWHDLAAAAADWEHIPMLKWMQQKRLLQTRTVDHLLSSCFLSVVHFARDLKNQT